MASKGLYANMNARKKAGISRPKSESTVSPAAYKNMKAGFPKKMKEGGMLKAVPQNKKKSLGKLPTPVREKMGFMKEGGNVNKGRRKRGVPTSDLGGSRMRASKGAEQPRSRSALAELGGTVDRKSKSLQPKKMKEGGIVDRQYLKGK